MSNMSKEKEAIDYLQFCYDISVIDKESLPKLGIALNLIDKLEKEVEEKQTIICAGAEKINQLLKENEKLKVINSMQKYRIEVIDERELISKDKIRNKIKELEETYSEHSEFRVGTIILVLKELLGE